MDSVIRRYCKLILLIALLVEAQNSSNDQSLPEHRRPRTTGRIVKLYAGYKPQPINCTREGFEADPKDCGIFYRCTQSGNGHFTVFKFQCGPGTVYDPETEVCNYPQSTKRLECGGLSNDINEIDEIQQEFHSSVITKMPIYNEQTTVHQNLENKNTHENLITPITNKKQDLNKTSLFTSTTVTSSSYSWNQYSSSSTIQPSPPTTNPQTSNTSHVTSDIGLPLKEKPNWQNNLCISDGFMGDYENCHKFYRCVRNQIGGFTKYEFSCSDFTVWDDDIQACNHPWAVRRSRCGKSGSNIGSTKILSTVPQTTSPKNLYFSENHNNTKDEKQFDNIPNLYQSQTSTTIQAKVKNQTQISYGNRVYKLDKKLGNQNETNVKEIQSHIINKNDVTQTQFPIDHSNQLTQTPTTTSTKSSSSFYNNEDKYLTHINAQNSNQCTYSGFIGDPNNCKIFYRCVDNGKGGYIRYEFSCGEGTFWDQNLEACNHAWAVKHCGSEQSLQETEITSPSVTKLSSSTMKPTQSYITSTKTTEKNVATFEETNDNDKNVGYNDHNPNDLTTTLSHTLFTTTVNILQNANNECRSSGFMGDTLNCKIFYRCIDDGKGGYIKHRFECGEGTVWDSHIEACNYPDTVENCSGNIVMSTETTTSKGTTALNNNNNITEPPLVTTTQFQINTELPDDKFEVSTATVLQNNNTFSNECKSAGFFGVKNDCKKFYRCVVSNKGDFKKYDFSCGEGTVWIQETQSCEHSNRVINCSLQNETNIYKQPDDFQHTSSSTAITLITSTLQPVITSNDNSVTEELTSNVCTSEGYHNDKQNCIKFYRCVDNGNGRFTKFEFICGEGTAWDVNIGGCNHIHLVESCRTSSSTSEIITEGAVYSTSTTMTITNAQESNSTDIDENCNSECEDDCSEEGYFGNTSDCKKFYRCVDDGKDGYMKYDFTCGDGTIWDDDIAACNHPQDVKNPSCESSTEENSTTDYTTSMNTTTISTTTQPATITTPNGEQLPNTTQETTKQPVNSNVTCSEAGYFPNPNDCKKFYRCVDDGKDGFIKYDFICGDGTIWDQDIDACNHPQDVENPSCKSSTEENSTTDFSTSMNTTTISTTTQLSTVTTQNGEQLPNTTQEPSKQPVNSNFTCSEAGYFPNPNDCKKFYQCVDDEEDGYIIYDFTCGDGTIWDQNIKACNHPQDVENPSCKSTTEKNSSTECTTSMNTTTVLTTTQSSTITTQNGEQLPNTTQETTKQPVNSNFTCTQAGYFPNPNDCKKFYRCVDWNGDGSKFSIFHFECGTGTIWDPKLETCNHEESVVPPRVCSGTQSQTENSEHGNSTTEATTTKDITTQQTTVSSPQTTMQTTIQQTTTSKCNTTQQTTTQQPSTTDKTTTLESTISIQTTSEPTTVHQQTTTTTSQTTTNEQSTTKQSTITAESTTQQSITTTTEKEHTSKKPITTTTEKEYTSKKPIMTTTEKEYTSKKPITTTQTSSKSTTIENTTTQKSTTEQNTQQTTVNDTTTTEQTTSTESSTTDGLILTTTQSSTETSTNKGDQETTTESTSTSVHKCPETDEEQLLFVCPTSFRRHPKYCNLFYQCTEEDDTHDAKIAVFTCPNNTIYDESKVQCVDEEKAEKSCDGEISSRRRVKRLGFIYKEPIVVTADTHSCSATGYLPFEKNSECSPAFLKCEKSKSGKLRGYVYQCPQNYIYWSISRKCERREYIKDCKRSTNNWVGRWEIPIEKYNVAW